MIEQIENIGCRYYLKCTKNVLSVRNPKKDLVLGLQFNCFYPFEPEKTPENESCFIDVVINVDITCRKVFTL